MAESESNESSGSDVCKTMRDLNKDLEKMLEDMEKISVQATWMAYDMVVLRTNPALTNQMKKMETAFLKCKEEIERNWQNMLDESKQK